MTKTDEELLALKEEGYETEILERYKELVVKIARSYYIVGGDIEDTVQEGMMGLYKAIRNYSPEKNSSFKTFAIMCIKHQIQTAIKKANTKKNAPLSSSVSLQSFADGDSAEEYLPMGLILQDSPVDKVINKENYHNLILNIKQILSKREYKVLTYYLQGYSYKEIAEILNLTNKSIDNSLTRIKNKLKDLNIA